jgi:hypothetical protein
MDFCEFRDVQASSHAPLGCHFLIRGKPGSYLVAPPGRRYQLDVYYIMTMTKTRNECMKPYLYREVVHRSIFGAVENIAPPVKSKLLYFIK